MLRSIAVVLVLGLTLAAQAQNCIPDQSITNPGFYPQFIEPVYVDSNYKQTLQIRVFKDTTVIIAGNPTVATIDSINVLDIKGMPTGFYYTCSRRNCSFIPDSTGCSTMEGKASKSQVGTYPLDIEIEVYGKIFGSINTSQKDTLRDFVMEVEDLSSTGKIRTQARIVYPNPSSDGVLSISQLFVNRIASVQCFNHLGQIIDFDSTDQKVDLRDQSPGLYNVVLRLTDGSTVRQKILIE